MFFGHITNVVEDVDQAFHCFESDAFFWVLNREFEEMVKLGVETVKESFFFPKKMLNTSTVVEN